MRVRGEGGRRYELGVKERKQVKGNEGRGKKGRRGLTENCLGL